MGQATLAPIQHHRNHRNCAPIRKGQANLVHHGRDPFSVPTWRPLGGRRGPRLWSGRKDLRGPCTFTFLANPNRAVHKSFSCPNQQESARAHFARISKNQCTRSTFWLSLPFGAPRGHNLCTNWNIAPCAFLHLVHHKRGREDRVHFLGRLARQCTFAGIARNFIFHVPSAKRPEKGRGAQSSGAFCERWPTGSMVRCKGIHIPPKWRPCWGESCAKVPVLLGPRMVHH